MLWRPLITFIIYVILNRLDYAIVVSLQPKTKKSGTAKHLKCNPQQNGSTENRGFVSRSVSTLFTFAHQANIVDTRKSNLLPAEYNFRNIDIFLFYAKLCPSFFILIN